MAKNCLVDNGKYFIGSDGAWVPLSGKWVYKTVGTTTAVDCSFYLYGNTSGSYKMYDNYNKRVVSTGSWKCLSVDSSGNLGVKIIDHDRYTHYGYFVSAVTAGWKRHVWLVGENGFGFLTGYKFY